jgi:hypothetical protein
MLEKANKRNIGSYEASHSNLDNYSHILEVDDKQKKLTEKWILPHVETITDDLCKIRANVDKRLKKYIKHSKSYPVGMCQEIRNEVYKEMLGTSGMNKDLKGLQMVRNFIREGGILKAFWGIDQEKYFQNAIQVGTSILDVANDTVDPRKPKIVFYPDMETAPIKRINSIEAMAEIMERYWGYEIYPNIYFPNLAPFFPIICIKKLIDPKTKKEVRFLKLAREPFDFFHMRNLFINTVVKKEGEETFGESNNFSRDFIVPANTTNDSRYENINGFNCNQQYNGCEIENPWGFWAGHISSNSPITTYGGGSICGATGNTTYGGGFAHCFIADTKVAMADGTEKNIQDVKLGDVLKGELGNNKVIGFHRPELGNEKLYSFNGGRHFVTAEHPFYTTDGWKSLNPAKTAEEHLNIEVSQLKVGDTLVTDHGLVKLRKVYGKSDRTDTQLYNFILDGDHTYYADGYLVHNKVGCSADGSGAPTYPQCPNGNYCLDNTPAPQGHLAYPPSSSNYGTCALPCSTPEPDPQAWCNSHPNGAFCSDDNFIHNCP